MMLSAAEKSIFTAIVSIYLFYRLDEPWKHILPLILAIAQLSHTLYRQSCWKLQGVKFVSFVPFWGNLNAWDQGKQESHSELFDKWIKKLGNCFGYFQDDIPAICLSDADLIMEVLKDKSNFMNGIAKKHFLRDFIGYALPRLRDEEWRLNRILSISWFKTKSLKQQIPKIDSVCLGMMEVIKSTLKSAGSGKPININKILQPHILDIMSRCVTDQPISKFKSFDGVDLKNVDHLMEEKHRNDIAGLFPMVVRVLQSLNLFWLLPPREMHLAAEFFAELETASTLINNSEGVECNGFLHMSLAMLSSQKEKNIGKWRDIEKEHIFGQIFTFMTRTVETISSALANLLFELAKNPQIQEKCFQEAKRYFNTDKSANEDFNEVFKFQRGCIHENLRLNPTLIRIFRVCGVDHFALSNGVALPRGCIVDMMISSVLKSDKYFPDPAKFIPERFSDRTQVEEQRRTGTYLQFGFGLRQCPGEMLSLLQMNIILSNILVKYRLCLQDYDKKLIYSSGTMLGFLYEDVELVLLPR